MKNKILFLFLFVFLLSEIFALGVSPGRTTIDFAPKLSKQVDFQILNSDKINGEVTIGVHGSLADYITLDKNRINLESNQESYKNSFSITLSESLSPGLHSSEIVILQSPDSSSSSGSKVGASVAVVTQVYVYVPYPGKFIESKAYVFPKNVDSYEFVFSVISRGEFDIVSLKANVDIYDSNNLKVSSFTTDSFPLLSGERKELSYLFNQALEQGEYLAKISLIYDGNVLSLEKSFTTSSNSLELQDISVNDFSLGQIAKLELLVENKLLDSASNVYADVHLFSQGSLLDNFKSSVYNIPGKSKAVLSAYWDTAGVKEGIYDTKVYLRYGENSFVEQDLQLEVSSYNIRAIGLGYVVSSGGGSAKSSSINFWLVLGIVILILINLLWFLLLRKKLNK